MSADNWRQCPKCLRKANAEKAAALEHAQAAYGKAPPEEYDALMTDARKPVKLEDTLAEYYEIGMTTEGEFCVEYSAHCADCGFGHKFKHEQKIKIV